MNGALFGNEAGKPCGTLVRAEANGKSFDGRLKLWNQVGQLDTVSERSVVLKLSVDAIGEGAIRKPCCGDDGGLKDTIKAVQRVSRKKLSEVKGNGLIVFSIADVQRARESLTVRMCLPFDGDIGAVLGLAEFITGGPFGKFQRIEADLDAPVNTSLDHTVGGFGLKWIQSQSAHALLTAKNNLIRFAVLQNITEGLLCFSGGGMVGEGDRSQGMRN